MKKLINIISSLSTLIGNTEEAAKEQFNLLHLTVQQMNYLESINILDNPNITELALQLKLSKPTVKVAVDKLIERDYVYKTQSDEDRRSAHLHLTEKGKLINQMHEYAHKRIAESILRKLNEDELKSLEVLLTKVLEDK
ncbi:MAG TPA: MarR family transcriptional regulator [Paludibacter sp.]|nr:MarR family transcriptional regulator [Paludibacter sp.]